MNLPHQTSKVQQEELEFFSEFVYRLESIISLHKELGTSKRPFSERLIYDRVSEIYFHLICQSVQEWLELIKKAFEDKSLTTQFFSSDYDFFKEELLQLKSEVKKLKEQNQQLTESIPEMEEIGLDFKKYQDLINYINTWSQNLEEPIFNLEHQSESMMIREVELEDSIMFLGTDTVLNFTGLAQKNEVQEQLRKTFSDTLAEMEVSIKRRAETVIKNHLSLFVFHEVEMRNQFERISDHVEADTLLGFSYELYEETQGSMIGSLLQIDSRMSELREFEQRVHNLIATVSEQSSVSSDDSVRSATKLLELPKFFQTLE